MGNCAKTRKRKLLDTVDLLQKSSFPKRMTK